MHKILNGIKIIEMRKGLKKYSFLLFVAFFLLGGIVFSFGYETEVDYPSINGEGLSSETTISEYTTYLVRLAFIFSAILAFAVLSYGGFCYLTAGDNPTLLVTARQRIVYAIFGLLVISSAYLILKEVNPGLLFPRLDQPDEHPAGYTGEPLKSEEGYTYFQTSLGKIIEQKILSLEAHEKFEGTNNISYLEGSAEYLDNKENQEEIKGIIEKVKEARDESETLKDLSQELKDLTDACVCGLSSCDTYKCGNGCCCKATGCPQYNTCNKTCGCSLNLLQSVTCNLAAACPNRECDLVAIGKTIVQIQNSMARLEAYQAELVPAQRILFDDYVNLKKAGMLTTNPNAAIPYGEFQKERFTIQEEYGEEPEVDTYGTWPDPALEVNEDQEILDPTTVYFDKKDYQNQRVLEQSTRLELFLIENNMTPQELEEIASANAEEVLSQYSPQDFMPPESVMNEISQAAITETSGEIGQEVADALSQELAEEITAGIAGTAQAGLGISAEISGEIANTLSANLPLLLNYEISGEISASIGPLLDSLETGDIGTFSDLLASGALTGNIGASTQGLNDLLNSEITSLSPALLALLNASLSDYIPEGELPPELINSTIGDILSEDMVNLLNSSISSYLPSELNNILNSSFVSLLPDDLSQVLTTSLNQFLPADISELLSLSPSDLLGDEISQLLSANIASLLPDQLTSILSLNIGSILPGDLINMVHTSLGEMLGIDLDQFFPDFILNFPEEINLSWEETDENGNTITINVTIIGLPNVIEQFFPGYTSIIAEIANIYNQVSDLLDTTLADFIPDEMLALLEMNFLDFLPAQIAEIMDLSFSELIMPEEIQGLLQANLKEYLPENIMTAFDSNLMSLLPDEIKSYLNTSIMDELDFETSDFLNSSLKDNLSPEISNLLDTIIADKLNIPSSLKETLLNKIAQENPELYNALTSSIIDTLPEGSAQFLDGSIVNGLPNNLETALTEKLHNTLPSSVLSSVLDTESLRAVLQPKLKSVVPGIVEAEIKKIASSGEANTFSQTILEEGVIEERINRTLSRNLPVIIIGASEKSSEMISYKMADKLAEAIGETISEKTSEAIGKKIAADLEKIATPIMIKMIDQGILLNFPHDLRGLNELK